MAADRGFRWSAFWRGLGAPGVWMRHALSAMVVLVVLGHVQAWIQLPGMDALARGLYDARQRWLMQPAAESRIVIVDIDERSLAQVGHWPWSRQRIAELIQVLVRERGATTVAMDMVFAEPTGAPNAVGLPIEDRAQALLKTDPSFAAALRRWLMDSPGLAQAARQLQAASQPDDALVDALRGAPVILGYYLTSDRGGARYGQLPAPVWRPTPGQPMPSVTAWSGYGANLPALAAVAKAGFFNSITDDDGLVRRLPVVAQVDGVLVESLALAAYRQWAGLDRLALLRAAPEVNPKGDRLQALLLSGARAKAQRVAIDGDAAAWINYRQPTGPQGVFTYVSAIDVLQRAERLPDLRGKLVLIGASAPGLQDVRATPVASVYPGVEAHASLIADLMQGQTTAVPPQAKAWTWILVLLVGMLVMVWLPRLRPTWSLLLCAVLLVGLVGLAWWAHAQRAWVIDLSPAVALVLAALLVNVVYGYFSERRLRRLTKWFGSYLPRTLVREMVADRQKVDMKADYRTMTVLFCDIRGFTGLAERLEPEALQSLLNQVLGCLSDCVGEARGTLDKYMGDSVMAFWGAPVATERHAKLAVACAQAMVNAVGELNPILRKQGLPAVQVGVGIATGEMFVGDMGSTRRRTYTVIGDAVNVAARLEGMTRTLDYNVLVNEATALQVPTAAWDRLDAVHVRGRQTRQSVYGLRVTHWQ